MKALKILWDFTRPHTIIGSFLSITALYLMALERFPDLPISNYIWTLVAALSCNIFITGLNQYSDHELDKINKPFLPLPSGRLTRYQALNIILACLALSLASSFNAGGWLIIVIAMILLIGTQYSLPPLHFKQHHLPAALAITGVRGILVNLGIGSYFVSDRLQAQDWIDSKLWALTAFVTLFSIAIAWFKDMYDTEGDARFGVKSFPLLYNQQFAFKLGNILVCAGFVMSILLLFKSHTSLSVLMALIGCGFLLHIKRSSIEDRASIYKFYMGFWVFFFLVYGVFIGDSWWQYWVS